MPPLFQCFLFFLCCRTSVDTITVTRWVWLMLGRCAIPREAVQLLRTMGCKLPSQLHMSLVSAHVLSYGWADVRFVKILCNRQVMYSVKLCLLINSYIYVCHIANHSHCRPCVEYAPWWLQNLWETVWKSGGALPDGSCVCQPQQDCTLVSLQRSPHHRVLWQRTW